MVRGRYIKLAALKVISDTTQYNYSLWLWIGSGSRIFIAIV